MNLWLDDVRDPKDFGRPGWVWVKSVNEAIGILSTTSDAFVNVSLDHDLGDYAYDGGDGVNLIRWMRQQNIWPECIIIHSSNPVGVRNMLFDIDSAGVYEEGGSNWRRRAG